MLGLPKSTEIHKLITKKKIYEHFGADMSTERRKKFDADIARMVLVNEVSPVSINLAAGENVQNFFVLLIALKQREFDPQNVAYIAKLFGQRLIFVLEYEGQQRLALWQTKLLMTEWQDAENLTLPLEGITLDTVWENIAARIAGFQRNQEQTLDEQIALAAKKEKLKKEIAQLEKQARAERQPKKKFELVQTMRKKKEELEGL